MTLRLLARAVAFVLALTAPTIASGLAAQEFERSELEIVSGPERYRFSVEVAVTPGQKAQGLMFRQSLAADAGMLFLYDRENIHTMWMRNTFVPLDMLFITSDGRIAHIVERTIPQSIQQISSRVPVSAVLEVNAGTVRRLGIRVGDRVLHPRVGG
ncbi:MAG: DUF192 domain-containing protein [Alphaproteobacteria bacterium]